ncbi:hypothetical protein [Rhodococcus opacus]|uniref:hypothetical protein n=1 Tax=Rhodococcus opacus TaxID=37919 RepID=UPI0038998129
MHLAAPPGVRIGQIAEVAEVDLAFAARIAVDDADGGVPAAETAPLGGESVQRPIRHHTALPGQRVSILVIVSGGWFPPSATHAVICPRSAAAGPGGPVSVRAHCLDHRTASITAPISPSSRASTRQCAARPAAWAACT